MRFPQQGGPLLCRKVLEQAERLHVQTLQQAGNLPRVQQGEYLPPKRIQQEERLRWQVLPQENRLYK